MSLSSLCIKRKKLESYLAHLLFPLLCRVVFMIRAIKSVLRDRNIWRPKYALHFRLAGMKTYPERPRSERRSKTEGEERTLNKEELEK